MIRIRITKDTSKYKTGEILTLSNNEAFGLLDSGYAVISKDVVSSEYTTKRVK